MELHFDVNFDWDTLTDYDKGQLSKELFGIIKEAKRENKELVCCTLVEKDGIVVWIPTYKLSDKDKKEKRKDDLVAFRHFKKAIVKKDWKTLKEFVAEDEKSNLDFYMYKLNDLSECIMDALHSYHLIRAIEQKDSDWMDEVIKPFVNDNIKHCKEEIAKY